MVHALEQEKWVYNFLDPYTGGLDGNGWAFGGTLYSQDLARMVSDIPDVRHVTEVFLFDMSSDPRKEAPGWEISMGEKDIALTNYDLYVVRKIRVRIEESM